MTEEDKTTIVPPAKVDRARREADLAIEFEEYKRRCAAKKPPRRRGDGGRTPKRNDGMAW